jgi:cell division septum initiation protein DivIVA
VVAGLFLAMPLAGQDADKQIKAEIESLQQSLKSLPASVPGFPDIKSQIDKQLQSASEAARDGRLYLSLQQLSQVPACSTAFGKWPRSPMR